MLWWEARRIPFNIILGLYGILCLIVFFWAIKTSGQLRAGEDPIEPVAVLAAPIGINVLYTLGWLVEVPTRLVVADVSAEFGPSLLKIGLGISVVLITLPAGFWVGYRLLQIVGVIA